MTMGSDTDESGAQSGFSLCLTADKTEYAAREPVRMTITAVNGTSGDLRLSFRDAQRFDFLIERDGAEVWRWSQGLMFAQMLGEETLGPGASLTFSAECEENLEPGLYQLTGILTAHPSPLSAKINIVIR